MAILSRPDDPLLILIRLSVIIVSLLTIYTSLVVEVTKRYIMVTLYTAFLACFTVVWTNLHAFNLISPSLFEEWRYVAGAAIYLAVIGKDIRYVYAAHRRRDELKKIETLTDK